MGMTRCHSHKGAAVSSARPGRGWLAGMAGLAGRRRRRRRRRQAGNPSIPGRRQPGDRRQATDCGRRVTGNSGRWMTGDGHSHPLGHWTTRRTPATPRYGRKRMIKMHLCVLTVLTHTPSPSLPSPSTHTIFLPQPLTTHAQTPRCTALHCSFKWLICALQRLSPRDKVTQTLAHLRHAVSPLVGTQSRQGKGNAEAGKSNPCRPILQTEGRNRRDRRRHPASWPFPQEKK